MRYSYDILMKYPCYIPSVLLLEIPSNSPKVTAWAGWLPSCSGFRRTFVGQRQGRCLAEMFLDFTINGELAKQNGDATNKKCD